MAVNNFKQRFFSISVMILLIIPGLITIIPSILIFPTTNALSSWTQRSYSDFNQGSKNNVEIVGSGDGAELKLIKTDVYYWKEQTVLPNPDIRVNHAMTGIWGTDNIVLFGGNNYQYNIELNDTWIYDLSTNSWTEKIYLNSPDKRVSHAMATIWGMDKALLFGGYNKTDFIFNDTWIYDVGIDKWEKLTLSIKPKARYDHAMSPIYGTNKVLLYGGRGEGGNKFVDTWIFDLDEKKWFEKISQSEPGPRVNHGLAFIHETDKVFLFGARQSNKDVWIYDYTENIWTKRNPAIYPDGRIEPVLTSIYGTDKVILFGGWNSADDYLKDTWIYDYSENSWIERSSPNSPNERYEHAIASFYGIDKVIIFGGAGELLSVGNQTYIYKHSLYSRNGTYISEQLYINDDPSYKNIVWNSLLPIGTLIKLQIKTAKTPFELFEKNFVGPDGNISSYYTSSPANIWDGHNGLRWIQYKVYFDTGGEDNSPALKEVVVSYNLLPVAVPVGPSDEIFLTENKPIFNWNFIDKDSDHQAAFQVLIDDNNTFTDCGYDSGQQNSVDQQWQFPKGTIYSTLDEGTWYWKVRTKDNDDDWGQYSYSSKFIIDTIHPTSNIQIPISNKYYNNLNTISGSASDTEKGTGVSKVEINIKRLGDDLHWSGSNWVDEVTWLGVVGYNNWTYKDTSIDWISGIKYEVQSRATDYAGNIEISEKAYPSTIIEDPIDNSYLNKITEIFGSAIDSGNSGIKVIEVCIKRIIDDHFWSGTNWIDTETWLIAEGTNKWSYDTSGVKWETDTDYLITPRGVDFADNIEQQYNSTIIMFDNYPPEQLSIKIDDNKPYSGSQFVSLQLEAEDSGSGIYQMAFSDDDNLWTAWEEFNMSKTYRLPVGDGEKQVYFKVQDYAGNIANYVTDDIIMDTTPPAIKTLTINNGASKTDSTQVIVSINATDEISGIYQMSFSNDRSAWSEWENYTETKLYSLHPGDGKRTLYVRVKDYAGNVADPISSTITLKTENDSLVEKERIQNFMSYGLITIIIIILLLIFVFIYFRRKRRRIGEEKKVLTPDGIYVPSVKPPETEVTRNILQHPLTSGHKENLYNDYQVQALPPSNENAIARVEALPPSDDSQKSTQLIRGQDNTDK
jgi:hypothetical protein